MGRNNTYQFYNKFEKPITTTKEQIIKHNPVDKTIEGSTLPTYKDIYFIVSELADILYVKSEEQKSCFIKQLTKALFSIGQIIFNSPLMNISKDEIYNLTSEYVDTLVSTEKVVDTNGKIEDTISDNYKYLCDTKQFKHGFLQMIIKAMVNARNYSKEDLTYKKLKDIVSKIGTTELKENEVLEIFKIGTELSEDNPHIKKYKVSKYPRLDIKLLLSQPLSDKITVLDYIRRKLGFSYCLGDIELDTADGNKYKYKIGSRVSEQDYKKLDDVAKMIVCTGDFSRNYGGLLAFNSKLSFLKNKTNPLNRVQTKTINNSISNHVKDIHSLAHKFSSNKLNHIDSIVLKYCEKKRYDKYIEHRQIIINVLNKFILVIFNGNKSEISKIWDEIITIVDGKIKEMGYKLLNNLSKMELYKKKKKVLRDGIQIQEQKYTISDKEKPVNKKPIDYESINNNNKDVNLETASKIPIMHTFKQINISSKNDNRKKTKQ